MEKYDLVVVGDANPDVVVRGAPEVLTFGQAEREVSGATLTLGGSGALVAHAAARLGLRTAFVGLLGQDHAGDLVLRLLEEAGVDVSGVRRDPGLQTAITVVFAKPDGDRAILTAPGSLSAFGPEHVDQALLMRARHVHVASAFLQPRLTAALAGLLAIARSAGAVTSLDTNDDPSGQWVLDREDLLGVVDYLLPNAWEAAALAFGPSGAADDPLPAARALAAAGPCVVVKCGAQGALSVDRTQVLRARLAVQVPTLVDTVGAGDAFDAGFVAGLSQGLDLRGALRLAVAVGTLSTRRVGGMDGQPGAAEAARLAEHVVVEDEE
jgi:sugar/nucleoside kinase (ribokinase family)